MAIVNKLNSQQIFYAFLHVLVFALFYFYFQFLIHSNSTVIADCCHYSGGWLLGRHAIAVVWQCNLHLNSHVYPREFLCMHAEACPSICLFVFPLASDSWLHWTTRKRVAMWSSSAAMFFFAIASLQLVIAAFGWKATEDAFTQFCCDWLVEWMPAAWILSWALKYFFLRISVRNALLRFSGISILSGV